MHKTLAIAVTTLLIGSTALARDFEGVKVPDTLPVASKELKLNGVGLRTKLFFHVYVAALYVETPTHEANALIASEQAKAVTLTMKRDLSKKQIAEALREGFEKNNREK